MKLAFSTLGVPGMPVRDVARLAAASGYDGVELRAHPEEPVHPGLAPAERASAAGEFRRAGVAVLTVAGYVRVAEAGTDEPVLVGLRELVDLAHDLGAAHVRVFPGGGGPHGPEPDPEADARAARRLAATAPYAAGRGVRLLLETHDSHRTGADVARVLGLVSTLALPPEPTAPPEPVSPPEPAKPVLPTPGPGQPGPPSRGPGLPAAPPADPGLPAAPGTVTGRAAGPAARRRAVGALWDVLHPWLGGEEPAATYAALAPHLGYVQVKDVASVEDTTTLPLGAGTLPLAACLAPLVRAGWDGWLCWEYEKRWYPRAADLPDLLGPAREHLLRLLRGARA
ncbi:sugar phosphate isomerase/epimerase [Streptomyces sp. B1866]|uniref:sugar phosphate isomerase/epimerase family protein n=1 Tax=Streptomyces sp. B1866 TaxID=3075431 RepID=UPI0028922788|nr:sugar phosphate isomerase/epimerase [Streptomyces sp. B1866]MDT3399327.1 sugar phosphate isomerase/epimerase [Streptomyces sp. B1866]